MQGRLGRDLDQFHPTAVSGGSDRMVGSYTLGLGLCPQTLLGVGRSCQTLVQGVLGVPAPPCPGTSQVEALCLAVGRAVGRAWRDGHPSLEHLGPQANPA